MLQERILLADSRKEKLKSVSVGLFVVSFSITVIIFAALLTTILRPKSGMEFSDILIGGLMMFIPAFGGMVGTTVSRSNNLVFNCWTTVCFFPGSV